MKVPGADTLPTLGSAVNRRGLIEVFEIRHPAVPDNFDGLQILHLTDLHLRRGGASSRIWQQLTEDLAATPVDLIALTGDYADRPKGDDDALAVLGQLAGAWRTRLGAFGVFGNHDSARLCEQARRIPGVHWLDEAALSPTPGLVLAGGSFPEDSLAIGTAARQAADAAGKPFVLALAHYPTEGIVLANFGVHLVLAGHTHGGQVRLSPTFAPHTSSDLPHSMPSGLLRVQDTLIAVSRGLGDAVLPIRVNCSRHAPLYVLRRGELPPATNTLRVIQSW